MKILDKYIVKNFLVGYGISFSVLIGLRVIIDLFVNLDEFTENITRYGLSTFDIIINILKYYLLNLTIYFRDFAGMITVVAAAFSLGRMVKHNELVAIMASGVSLKRVIMPIIISAIILTGLLVIDQELLIPPLSDKLVRGQDAVPGEETYDVKFLVDTTGSLLYSQKFDVKTQTMYKPTIITRKRKPDSFVWDVTGFIEADKAIYDDKTDRWMLVGGLLTNKGSDQSGKTIEYYISDIKPKDIPIRRRSEHKTMLSSRQLSQLASQGTKIKDLAQLYSQKHYRVTEPIINLIMLMISLPILVCRDPKSMKSAVIISFVTTGSCFMTTFVCKMAATEVIFDRVIPEFWAWLPVFIFFPIAYLQLDYMKT